MNYIKRAFAYIWQKKGQSALLILIMSTVLTFVLSGIIIKNAAISATQSVTKNAGSTITVSVDRQKMFEQMRNSGGTPSSIKSFKQPTLDVNTLKKAAKLSTVASYNITTNASVNAESFDTVSTTSGSSGGMMFGGNRGNQGDTQLSGVTATNLSANFEDKDSVLKSGRQLTSADANTNNVMVESELAKQNNIKVGSTIKVKTTASKAKNISLKVVGIYTAKTSTSNFPGMDPSNTIYTSYTLPSQINGTTGKASSVTYTLNNSNKESSTQKQIKKLINNSKFSVTSDSQTYAQLLQPMKNVESFANKIVWIVAIAGTIILALIVILAVRSRQHEIGTLVSLGETKLKIVGQLFIELFVVMVVSLFVAGALGNVIGNKVGNQLLTQQSQTTNSTGGMQGAPGGQRGGFQGGNNGGGMMGQHHMGTKAGTKVKALKKLNVKISPSSMVKLGGLGLVIIALAVGIGSISILRLRPKEILATE
ncbi:ABC transporter permease [Pediococcus claussenii]|uniref:FtsX-like permease family protein n=1 Tax=Pediococcus claussenii (strain ATCC BAA-344 / DSM 14800 / JCM 18046 / KCTC 3811 / LMG 21948 / P06) TaxID=701521 RepID=G8PAU5_PEDCP|nr:ABC transporter permease [Pediococcus claussenii]AEV95813.1 ftsX-like permease family protein [Pediococcus claussenii ATCC BAA-344]ANZ69311.1 peptide ABC transporter permease [Pediococcus claussenii]ANZ71131.1 peptide ABC transporter permease [Pediococcus claussenii]KRN20420.1 hypothetical protein IV79_GL000475 [Pediococcus claussenii]